MTVENIDLWVSATGFESPYYRFYTDSSGSQQLSELAFDTSKSYTFYRLNGETSHPFYISDTGYKQTFSDSILITGDANPSNGITGDQSFKVEFNQLSGNIEQLLYYCSSHQLMLGNIALFDNPVPPSIPSIPDLIPASDDGTSDADNITSETTPTFIGTVDADTNIELFADGNSLGTTTTDSDGDWSFSVPGSSALSDGIIAITAIASRSAGQIAVLKTNPISPSSIGRTAQEFRNTSAFAALKDDGSVITWGDPLSGGDSSSVAFSLQSGVSQIFSTSAAFAALKQDGSVITWGDDGLGGDSSSVASYLKSGVSQISSTSAAFAALKDDGSVFTWGGYWDGGTSDNVTSQLQSGVSSVFSTYDSFAALKDDGSVVTWGGRPPESGGNSSSVASYLKSDVSQVFSTSKAFAALKNDGSVICWGESDMGGNSSSVNSYLSTNVIHVFSNQAAFAALKNDGSVITWGDVRAGGDSSSVASHLKSGIRQISSTLMAFAALNDEGSVFTWGFSGWGGDSRTIAHRLQSGVSQIFSTGYAFAALKDDGSVVTWGELERGGDSTSVDPHLQSGVVNIYSNNYAFAALKDDGSVITWGYPVNGGDSSSVASHLQSGVSQIFSTNSAFAALKDDGSVITWGDDSGGGDSSSVAFQLQSGVVSFSDPFQDDQFIVETSFSNSSPALNLNVDTIAPAFISADNVTLVIDDNFAASQVVYVSKTTDSSSVSFDLKANNNDAAEFFSIDSLTGGVTLNKVPDHQGRSSYFFTVIATDSAGNVSDQIVRLEISNLEEIPIIQSIDAISAQRKVTIFKIQQPVILSGKHVDVVIAGTKKKDKITGTSSEEILAGMKRKNFLSGGDSTDGFLFNQPKGFGNKHADKITDFDSKEGDSILLDNDLFGLGKKIKFSSYGSRNKVNKAAKSKNDFVYDEKKGLLYFNENRKQKGWGDGGLFAKLHGVPELGADDFTIV